VKYTRLNNIIIFLFTMGTFCALLISQETEIQLVTVGNQMPDFTLESYQGGSITISDLKGKNILLIFPRGLAREASWCHIDNYRYAELMELEKKENIRKKYNVEILYILPYNKDMVKQWIESNPKQLQEIESAKYPEDPEKLDDTLKQRMEYARKLYPDSYKLKEGEVPTPFPILIDANHKVSEGLGIFSTDWHGSNVDQCMSSVFIIDKEGILQFKYIGQSTFDRPSFKYLLKMLEAMNED
jgi:peroxiredoxin